MIATVDTAPWSEEMEELETENETVDFLNEKLVRHSFHEIVYFDSNAESDFIYKHFPEDDQEDQGEVAVLVRGKGEMPEGEGRECETAAEENPQVREGQRKHRQRRGGENCAAKGNADH